jgi:hypothetical protein
VNLAQAENHEGAMKKWLKRPNSTPFGFMPAGPRRIATKGYATHSLFFFFRLEAEENEGGAL